MKIAVVGAGFAGLACCVFAKKFLKPDEITLFDQKGIGAGASGIATGLLHQFSGLHSKKNPFGDLAMSETLSLLKEASITPQKTGMIRPTTDPKQIRSFKMGAKLYPELVWREPVFKEFSGLFIEDVYLIDPLPYLNALHHLSQATLQIQTITSLQELKHFDKIILTTGASLIKESAHLPITSVKGQILTCDFTPEIPINGLCYLVKNTLGATYEHHFNTEEACFDTAKQLLLPRIAPFVPDLKLTGCKAAFRASTKDHMPLISRIDEKTYTLTGLGSKGLLYHALFAKKLCKYILASQ